VKVKYTETVLPTLGFVTDDKSSQAMSGIRVATHQRELERASPLLLVKAMDQAGNVRAAGSQRLGQQSLPAVSFTDGGTTFTILFDPKTHLPAAVRTRDDDNINGDSNYDMVLTNWKTVGGAQIAQSLSYRVNDVEVAKLNGRPGDILTLADDAPTRFHRAKLLWAAADALFSMERFKAAKSVLEDLLAVEPNNRKAQTQLGLVLGRLGMINEAKVHMLGVAEKFAGDTEAQGILGRVYKDLWRLEWKDLETLADRQMQAVATAGFIVSSIRSYHAAARKHFDYYTGINVVAFVRLLEHLKNATGDDPADPGITDADNLAAVVRFSAQNTLDVAGFEAEEGVWAAATLGELEIVMENTETARKLYRDAANAPSTTYFNLNSMLEQVCLFESLGFRPEAVAAVKKVLEQRQKILGKKFELRFKRVFIASGHMIDAPDRPDERFPPRKEGAVRERIAQQLETWSVGAGDLAICGAARGADLLFGELCSDRGAEVWLYLALPEAEFLEASVRLPNSDWEERYFKLRDREGVKVFLQSDRLKSPPKGTSVFARNNLWMINTARVEANDPKNLYAVLVWDEKPTGDGPGGTSDFAVRVKKLGGRLAPIINPTKL